MPFMLPASDASALTLLVDSRLSSVERDRVLAKLGPEAKRIAAMIERDDTTAPLELRTIAEKLRALAARPSHVSRR